jgi:cell division GTPase FtsZ
MSIIDEIINNQDGERKNDNISEKIAKSQFTNNFGELNKYGNFKITVLGLGGAGCNVIAHMKTTRK